MNWSTSVYTTLSSDTEPSIVITFDSAKYIFNAGENTTRAVMQSGRGWKKVKALFMTQLGTQRSSGVPGLFMSVADGSPRVMDVVGPKGLLHLIASMRLHTFRKTLGLKVEEVPSVLTASQQEPVPVFKDENITVFSIPVVPSPQPVEETSSKDDVLWDAPERSSKRKRSRSPDSPSKRISLDSSVPAGAPQNGSSLMDRYRNDPQFDPYTLEGDEADAWRRLIIDHMFTWVEPPPKTVKKGKQKQVAGGASSGSQDAAAASLPQVPHWAEDALRSQGKPPGRGRRSSTPAGSIKQLPKFTPSIRGAATSYIIVGPRVRGKFNAERAAELGLFGPRRGQVARGETVTFMVDDGSGGKIERTVRPEDCLGENESTKIVMVLDVPSPSHIDSLTSAFDTPAYSSFRVKKVDEQKDQVVHIIHHILGPGVLEDERYKLFMNGFSSETQHVVSSADHSPDPLTFTSAGLSQLRLNQLDPNMFPLLHYNTTPQKELALVPSLPPLTSFMESHAVVDVRPPRLLATDPLLAARDRFHPVVASEMPLELSSETREKFSKAQRVVSSRMAELAGRPPKPGDELVVISLGTNSAISSRYRNVSGHLVQIPDWGNVLLDAGEGTWGQMTRCFGMDPANPSNVWHALRGLKCVFVSHAHADHHIGLAKILAMRKKLDPPPSEPLYLVTTMQVHLCLREFAELEDLGLSESTETSNGVIPILSEALNVKQIYKSKEPGWKNVDHSREAAKMLCDALGLAQLNTVDVAHRTKALGSIMTHRDGWRLVYSGDTMPCEALVQAGQNATLLIHEATMGNDQEDMAFAKAHSTVSQAINVGARMRAENVLLTHFSSRYPTVPRYFASPRGDGIDFRPNVALAMDHARVRVGDLWKMSAYLRAVEQSFWDMADEADVEEEAAMMQANLAQ
ncbi:hypothetical protein BC834DRAFT_882205 [Gloeopeniophorella convolvens]|nr:hypothetical protein BC834DRAFT_882205 [Gloeopeniophorella convolvens]